MPNVPVNVAVVLAACLALAFIDVRRYKIYNAFTYPLFAAGLLYHALAAQPPDLGDSLLGGLFGFAVLLPFYALGGVGGGDVKLMTAIGAWLGLQLTIAVFLASSLVTGVYALIIVVGYGRVRETWANICIGWLRARALARQLGADDRIETTLARTDRGRQVIPFAAMVALGLFALLVGVGIFTKQP
jgi:prepilin peptidase CpaA